MNPIREKHEWIPPWLRVLAHLGTKGYEDSDAYTVGNCLQCQTTSARNVLERLEHAGLIESEERDVSITVQRGRGVGIEVRRLAVYRLTPSGRERLEYERKHARRFGGGA